MNSLNTYIYEVDTITTLFFLDEENNSHTVKKLVHDHRARI